MQIVLRGRIPAKKNLLRRSKDGGMFRDEEVSYQIKYLTQQARLQWKNQSPLVRPSANVLFYVTAQRADLDNMWTTCLDCLVKGGVLKNDNIKNGPRPVTYDWVESNEDGVVIDLEGGIQQLGLRAEGMGQ